MKQRGAVTLVFDDGYQHIWQHLLPQLDRTSTPAVFALPLDPLSRNAPRAAPLRPWQHWRDISPQHELAAHSLSHRDLTTLPAEQLEQELRQPAVKLNALTLVYPGGAHNDTVVAAAARHYAAARTVRPGLARLSPRDPYRLPAFDFTRRTFSVPRANFLALRAWLTNRWLIETYHVVSDEITEPEHRVALSDFLQHLAFLKKLPLRLATIRDILGS